MKIYKPIQYEKVWGSEEWIANMGKYCGKLLNLKEGYRCSYHHHKIKDETFYILKGKVFMKVEGADIGMEAGEAIHIPPNTRHSFTGITDAVIIEISTQHFEDDSHRDDESGLV